MQPLQGAKEAIELVGGVEIGFELAGAKAVAQFLEAPGVEIKSGRENFLVGENDVAPGGVGAAREAQRVAESGAGKSDGQAVFVEAVV